MSILKRILQIFRARFHSTLDRLEHPGRMADEYVRQLETEQARAREALSQLAGNLGILRSREQRSRDEAERWQRRAELAVRAGDDQQARLALHQRRAQLAAAEQYRLQHEIARLHLEEMQGALRGVEDRVRQAGMRRDLIKVKVRRAQSQTTTMGGGARQLGERLAQTEERLDERLARAEALAQLQSQLSGEQSDSLHAERGIDQELAELKRRIARQG